MHRRLAELDRIDRRHGLGTMPTAADRRRPRRDRGRLWPALLGTAVVLAVVLALSPDVPGQRVRALLGHGDERLAGVVEAPHGTGDFRFEMTQPGSTDPVSYDPCRPIGYVINPAGAPPSYEAFVRQAVGRVSAATGFEFRYRGITQDRSFEDRGRAPTDAPPVLIGWATPDEVPRLAGRVAGLGGSTAVQQAPDHLDYVTGMVALDRDAFADLSHRPGGLAEERAIVMHELGHVVGLAHVEDRSEQMYADNLGLTSYGPGDLEGLAALGAVPCL